METYYGHVRTPADAIILFEACRIGMLPRVQRRLSEKERQSIRSGSVFVWDEREAGMRRWTDGKSWSASRVSGSFLTYREMEGKRGGGGGGSGSGGPVAGAMMAQQPNLPQRAGKTPDSTRGSDDDRADNGDEGPDGYRYKPDGLMKQSFSITTSTGQHLHLISYYSRPHHSAANLQQPSTDPALRHVRPQKGLYPESTVNDQQGQGLPVVTRGPMNGAPPPPPPPYSISPHHHHPMAAYAPRPSPGAHHHQQQPPAAAAAASYNPAGYAWPPTPLATPPNMPMPYRVAYLPSLPSPNEKLSFGPTPLQQHQPLPLPLPLPSASAAGVPLPAPPAGAGAGAATSAAAAGAPQSNYPSPYDRAPHHQHQHQHQHHRESGAGVHSSFLAGGFPGRSSPEIRPLLHQQQQEHAPAYYQRPQQSPPPYNGERIPSSQTSLGHYPSGPAAPSHAAAAAAATTSPQQLKTYYAPAEPSASAAASASATSVPSIRALMNSSTPLGAAAGPAGRGLVTGRSAADGPRDIPSEKIGFGGEDMRALRQLDRVFSA